MLLDNFIKGKLFYWMFLLKQRFNVNKQKSVSPTLKNATRLEECARKMSSSEIKGHRKNSKRGDTRNYLIEYTQKIFKGDHKDKK